MNNELYWRLGFFISILAIMMLLEGLKPARQSLVAAKHRWFANFGLVFISSVIARLTVPIGLTALAIYNTEQGFGLFNLIQLPLWLTILLSVLILDILIYWQHRLFHQVPMLWRLHKVHHADSHIDASTGLRFHPFEIVLSILVKLIAVTALGAPAIAVLIFEIALNGFALFNHANIRLPKKLEQVLRFVVITQQLHRIHHSQLPDETNSNFGFSVIWWDKLFASYKPHANETGATLKVGLSQYTATKKNASIITLLLMPFK
jgi:sterol desaturase/sphingolipid hydroxylase (fatty acid hydroxylase superfamily)